jgi:hypothetical protein
MIDADAEELRVGWQAAKRGRSLPVGRLLERDPEDA